MSHTSLTYHIIFGTYRRLHVIDIAHERELYKYIYDLSTNLKVIIRRIGGMPDHIHILCDIPAKLALADYVKLIKSETSKFMRINPHFPNWSRWAEGYGAFTVEAASRTSIVAYIMNQKLHHAGMSFANEYSQILNEAGLNYPET